MATSPIFSQANRLRINAELKNALNQNSDYLSDHTSTSTRAAGDAVQSLIGEKLGFILGDLAGDYPDTFARRAMADLAFTDTDGNYHVVDVKTHRSDVSFSMPNLILVERLCRFYEVGDNYFDILLVDYSVSGNAATVSSCEVMPIEWLDWSCLIIGALGWGQIQIANAKNVRVRPQPRREWMLTFCERILAFYQKEIAKVSKRIVYFEKARAFWIAQNSVETTNVILPTLPFDEGEVG